MREIIRISENLYGDAFVSEDTGVVRLRFLSEGGGTCFGSYEFTSPPTLHVRWPWEGVQKEQECDLKTAISIMEQAEPKLDEMFRERHAKHLALKGK